MSGTSSPGSSRRTRAFPDRNQLLAHVASLYYESRRSQAEIASELGLSRSMISRLIDEAHRRGLVDIRINWPTATVPQLESDLKAIYGLRSARVVDATGLPDPAMLRQLGVVAAAELASLLHDGMTISVAWGSALWETVQALPASNWSNTQVTQCIGALSRAETPGDGPALAQLLAQKLGGRYRYLHAPLVVDSEDVCRGLLSDRTIAETLKQAEEAELALVGVGTTNVEQSSLVRAGYLSSLDLSALQQLGAVGDICARYYDHQGLPVIAPIDRRIVGIRLNDLKRIPTVLGVAGGQAKIHSLLGALRGQYLDILITDRDAAEYLVDAARDSDASGDR